MMKEMPTVLEKTDIELTLQKLATNIATSINGLITVFETLQISDAKKIFKELIINTKWMLKIKEPKLLKKLLNIQIKITQYSDIIELVTTKEQVLVQAINLAKVLLRETQKLSPKSTSITTYAAAINKAEKLSI